jgi:hypothetical protein
MFENYGARGITMSEEWVKDFTKFLDDVGPKPKSDRHRQYSLDRIDNNKGYEPGNVRWANAIEQARNKRNNKFFTVCCQTKCLKDWADDYGMSYKLAHERLGYGWTVEKSLSPIKHAAGRKNK